MEVNFTIHEHKLPTVANADPKKVEEFRAMIGGLIYISVWTRPDIAFAVNFLARYMTHPNDKLIKAAHSIFKYLKAPKEKGILMRMVVYCLQSLGALTKNKWYG